MDPLRDLLKILFQKASKKQNSYQTKYDEADEHDEAYEANETDKDDEADEDDETDKDVAAITITQNFARTFHSGWQNRQAKQLDS